MNVGEYHRVSALGRIVTINHSTGQVVVMRRRTYVVVQELVAA